MTREDCNDNCSLGNLGMSQDLARHVLPKHIVLTILCRLCHCVHDECEQQLSPKKTEKGFNSIMFSSSMYYRQTKPQTNNPCDTCARPNTVAISIAIARATFF